MPIYSLTLPKTYLEQGFFNVTVEYDRYVREDEGPIEMILITGETEQRLQAYVNRRAQGNGTARVMGGTVLRRWFQEHFQLGDQINVEIESPHFIRIVAPDR